MMLELPRRRFLTAAIGLIAAPAIVRAANIMPVKSLRAFDGVRITPGNITSVQIINGGAGYTSSPVIVLLEKRISLAYKATLQQVKHHLLTNDLPNPFLDR